MGAKLRHRNNDSVVLAFPGWFADPAATRARVAERADALASGASVRKDVGFKSPLAHVSDWPRVPDPGLRPLRDSGLLP